MRATKKILLTLPLVALFGAGCSMNDKSAITPMDYVRDDWNDTMTKSVKASQAAYSANQNLVESGIVFHDYVQKDMGLSPSGVWYPTYEMADGKVPLEGPAPEYCPYSDPAKEEM